MASAWRQGSFIAPSDATSLGLVSADTASDARVIVITHSCDLANPKQIDAEVVVGHVVDEAIAKAFANGHSTRKLSLALLRTDGIAEFAIFEVSSRLNVPSASLELLRPWNELSVSAQSKHILQRWLAQRYARAEFPDAFIERIQLSGVGSRIDSLMKAHSWHVRSVYFDLDTDEEKVDANDPYQLGIYFVFAGDRDTAKQQANFAAQELAAVFSDKCHTAGSWKWIELIHCQAISDEAFSVSAANEFRRWRMEHRSIRGEPAERDD